MKKMCERKSEANASGTKGNIVEVVEEKCKKQDGETFYATD